VYVEASRAGTVLLIQSILNQIWIQPSDFKLNPDLTFWLQTRSGCRSKSGCWSRTGSSFVIKIPCPYLDLTFWLQTRSDSVHNQTFCLQTESGSESRSDLLTSNRILILIWNRIWFCNENSGSGSGSDQKGSSPKSRSIRLAVA